MPSVSRFLLERLSGAGVRHVFGVPGDYILSTFKILEESKEISLVSTTDESPAGFAADAYARLNGIGAVCTTYNVGALKLVNSIGQAHAELSPVVVIVGSPGLRERKDGVALHHTIGDFDTQRQIFSKVTCANTVLDNLATAGYEIDRVLEALKYHSQPVYIEIPRDVAEKPIQYDPYTVGTPASKTTNQVTLKEALEDLHSWVAKSQRPVILAGVEVSRFGLTSEILGFAERNNIPIFTEALSKSVIPEDHPLFGGVYFGEASEPGVRDVVEQSDCLLMFGVIVTDMMFGFAPSRFRSQECARINTDRIRIRNHFFEGIIFKDFCKEFFQMTTGKRQLPRLPDIRSYGEYEVATGKRVTVQRMFEKINRISGNGMVVIADIGDSLFGSLDLRITSANSFISPAFYTPMGSAIPAALGVMCATKSRPIVIVGDGAFQMSLSEISTMVRMSLNPIIFVLNNGGYTTERFLLDGKFNDVASWNYHMVNAVFGGGIGFLVRTEDELENAVEVSLDSREVSVINVVIDPRDITPALRRITRSLSKRI